MGWSIPESCSVSQAHGSGALQLRTRALALSLEPSPGTISDSWELSALLVCLSVEDSQRTPRRWVSAPVHAVPKPSHRDLAGKGRGGQMKWYLHSCPSCGGDLH